MERNIKLEILEANYWENFKFAKDISLIFPINHPKRVTLDKELLEMITEINNIKNNI
jgi:hypothetical protein